MRTCGQRRRMCATRRATSSTAPAAASMLAGRSLATSQVAPAEYVQRQVAVTVVISVEEPPLLHPVHRVVGRIQIEDDLARRALVRLQELVDKKPFDGYRIVTDLVIARRLKLAQLQPVQRRLARNRRAILASRQACPPAPPSSDRGASDRGR